MKLTCKHCGAEYDGRISRSASGRWSGQCPTCAKAFPVNVPKGKIVMAFTDKDEAAANPYATFLDDFKGPDGRVEGIVSYYAFDTPEQFIAKWRELVEEPDGMWYWVLTGNGRLLLSGACDPYDEASFADYFGWDKIQPTAERA